jgi:signal transduction histidine kinase
MKDSGLILLVDDEDALRWNMRAFLEDLGFQVLEAARGEEAIAICQRQSPQLVLLDINMPEMDGFEVCRHLKANPETAEIPVIFITAFLRVADKVNAFQCGGVDYITKPFHFEEVEARVRAHLELHRQRRELMEQHEALHRLERQRDSFIHMLAHDMRGPLTSIMGSLDLVLLTLPKESRSLAVNLERAVAGADQLSTMITQMLELNRLESGCMPLDLDRRDLALLAREAAESMRACCGHRGLSVTGPEHLFALCDGAIVKRILGNLLGNACKFTSEEGLVEIQVIRSGGSARVAVVDNGPGLPAGFHQVVFDKFAQAPREGASKGFGLGLAFCKLAVEAQGGEIGVESEPGHGCTFWFTLPLAEAQPL